MNFGMEKSTSVTQLPVAKLVKNVILYFSIVFAVSLLLNEVFDTVFTKVDEVYEAEASIMFLFEIIAEFSILIMVFAYVIEFSRKNILNDSNVSYELIDAFVLAFTLVATQTNLAAKMTKFTELF